MARTFLLTLNHRLPPASNPVNNGARLGCSFILYHWWVKYWCIICLYEITVVVISDCLFIVYVCDCTIIYDSICILLFTCYGTIYIHIGGILVCY